MPLLFGVLSDFLSAVPDSFLAKGFGFDFPAGFLAAGFGAGFPAMFILLMVWKNYWILLHWLVRPVLCRSLSQRIPLVLVSPQI